MRKAWPWILTGVTFLWCIVIWQFSLRDSSTSAQTSGAVLDKVNDILSAIGLDGVFTPKTIRKTAHFSEFFVLGVLAAASLQLHGFRHFSLIAPAVVFAVAGIDELLQFLSPGRGPSFWDVLLDTAGGLCGIGLFSLAVLLALSLRERRSGKKQEKNSK